MRHLNDEKDKQSENVQDFYLHLYKILGGPEELVPQCVETAARILSAMTEPEKVEALERIIEDTVASR
jgi:H2-forming N5,N10-methylenetetrahydromethanopterin dehydrogenase-like enzyme